MVNSKDESVHQDDMHDDAIETKLIDKEVEHWSLKRAKQIQNQEQEQLQENNLGQGQQHHKDEEQEPIVSLIEQQIKLVTSSLAEIQMSDIGEKFLRKLEISEAREGRNIRGKRPGFDPEATCESTTRKPIRRPNRSCLHRRKPVM